MAGKEAEPLLAGRTPGLNPEKLLGVGAVTALVYSLVCGGAYGTERCERLIFLLLFCLCFLDVFFWCWCVIVVRPDLQGVPLANRGKYVRLETSVAHAHVRKRSCHNFFFFFFFCPATIPFFGFSLASTIPPLYALILIVVIPVLWGLPIAMITTELATAIPSDGGYLYAVVVGRDRLALLKIGVVLLAWTCHLSEL